LGDQRGATYEEWALVSPLLPLEHGRECRPVQDGRPYFEGMMWIARTGAQCQYLPDEHGKRKSVFQRYRRWVTTGVFDAMLKMWIELTGRDTVADMIDSTMIRAKINRRNPAPRPHQIQVAQPDRVSVQQTQKLA
jgi:transposase